ncbi:MAG: hypothetical protein AABX03_03185 [Nanoarchaeota archaeon]
MSLKSNFLREFTKQIIVTINKEQNPFADYNSNPNNSNIKTQFNEPPASLTIVPVLSSQIVNEIENPQLAEFLNNNQSNQFNQFEENYENQVQEEYQEDENTLYLGKLTNLFYDPNLVSVECYGTGRFISIKTRSKVMSTTITLSNEEIEHIIRSFSNISRIPRIGGIFKAIAENLLVTAIESHSGSRFIISKIPKNV